MVHSRVKEPAEPSLAPRVIDEVTRPPKANRPWDGAAFRAGLLVFATIFAVALAVILGLAPANANGGARYFPETGQWVAGDFLAFFDTRGGIDIFGLPLTAEYEHGGVRKQVFQRARLELRPDNPPAYRVQPGLLGQEYRGFIDPPIDPARIPSPGDRNQRYFPETGQVVAYAFLYFFQSRGGLDIFGYPITGEFHERGVTVQYFQRARMEWRPGNPAAYRVQLGLLGAESLGYGLTSPTPVPTPTGGLPTPAPVPTPPPVPTSAATASVVTPVAGPTSAVPPAQTAAAPSAPAGTVIDLNAWVGPAAILALVLAAALILRLLGRWTSRLPRLPAPLEGAIRRVAEWAGVLLTVAFLAQLGLLAAEKGRAGVPVTITSALADAASGLFAYLVNHPATYYWSRQNWPAAELVFNFFGPSVGLLLVAMTTAACLGIPLGVLLAMTRSRIAAPLVLAVSVIGISTPSFLLGMLFWIADIQLYRVLGTAPLPPTGFGWDEHVVMPALVLAARPLAQVVQITYVSLVEVLRQDYIRTAHAKGLRQRWIITRHALRNVMVPVLTTLGASLRFSLASLPVVEVFFVWPGVGLALWRAIGQGNELLVTDVIVLLGLFFLAVNGLLEAIIPRVAPHVRAAAAANLEEGETPAGLRERLADIAGTLVDWWKGLRRGLRPAPASPPGPAPTAPASVTRGEPMTVSTPRREVLRAAAGNPMLVLGGFIVFALSALVLGGEHLASANPYETHGLFHIGGEIAAPPFKPSVEFPWGSDPVGRDVQALVLSGARQTLTMALLATLARLVVGALLGALAGWWHRSTLDRLITGAVSAWAAFPVTLFAMIVIQALGIQEGMPVFVAALCIVGWGEIAQVVRAQVIAVKPQLYVEAARTLGARAVRILGQHVMPQLGPALLVMAVLEMGSVLMLLAELGFLNVFLGGGFKAAVAEGANMAPIIYYFSDVPEWAALLANIRNWWRSYPWMAWYPGLAFCIAILGFNLAGQGLRRFLDDTRINIGRLFRPIPLASATALIGILLLVLRSGTGLDLYKSTAEGFDAARAMADVRALAAPEMGGRETGTPGAKAAAEYVARRMEEMGLQPAGDNETFIQTYACPRYHLAGLPTLSVSDGKGGLRPLTYATDFREYTRPLSEQTSALSPASLTINQGEGQGRVVGLALGPLPEGTRDVYGLTKMELSGVVLITLEGPIQPVAVYSRVPVLMVVDDEADLGLRVLPPVDMRARAPRTKTWPVLYISPRVAEELLATAGSSLAELRAASERLATGQVEMTTPGVEVTLSVPVKEDDLDEVCYNAIGFLPGVADMSTTGEERGLDSRVVMVSAYYDGPGRSPEGALFPAANDNASGVAVMLEMARQMKNSPYQPKRTVVFTAWAEGERGSALSLSNVMNAKSGFGLLRVDTVMELSGMGGGDGQGVALSEGSSFRLVQLYQDSASRFGLETTTRGRGPHFGTAARAGFGGRSALSLYLSWDGADRLAHSEGDVAAAVDPEKIKRSGQASLLALMVLSREVGY